jgi:hypothetical protein
MNIEEEFQSDEITSLSQLTKEQFQELLTSENHHVKKYLKYATLEFSYRIKSYEELNKLFDKIE